MKKGLLKVVGLLLVLMLLLTGLASCEEGVELTPEMEEFIEEQLASLKGEQGEPGSAGPQGGPGPQGIQGGQGEPGPKGSTGAKGATGSTGTQGEQGEQGPIGYAGPRGPAGSQGPSAPPEPTALSIVLRTYGDGVAGWEHGRSRSGLHSVYLDAGTVGGANAGRIEVWINPIPLAGFTGASYYVWEPTSTQHGGEFPYVTAHPYGDPYINLYLDLDNDGVYDECLEGLGSIEYGTTQQPTIHPTPTSETWVEMEEGYGFYDSNNGLSQGTWISAHTVGTLAEWKAYLAGAYTSCDVVGIKITFGFWADDVTPGVYVDDITISGTTYNLGN